MEVDLAPFITGRIPPEELISAEFTSLIEHNDTATEIVVRS